MIVTGRGPMPLWGALVLCVSPWCWCSRSAPAPHESLGARAHDDGVKGRFTATHAESAGTNPRRHWVGTFVSDHGGTTATDVTLRQNERVVRDAAKPVDHVSYLIEDPTTGDPLAFTDDYDTGAKVVLGIVFMVVGSVVTTGLLIVYLTQRHRRRGRLQG